MDKPLTIGDLIKGVMDKQTKPSAPRPLTEEEKEIHELDERQMEIDKELQSY